MYNGSPSGSGLAIVSGGPVYKGSHVLPMLREQYRVRSEYHAKMAEKWESAKWRPWLASSVDPPAPPVQITVGY